MSRFYLLGAQDALVGTMRRRLKAGTTVADTASNALPGDVLCPQFCSSPNVRMVALDSAAVSAFAAMGITASVGQALSGPPTGADSIDV
jgi:hypothetical protein